MSLSTGRYQLASANKSLKEHWEQTQRSWRDEVREEFTHEFWDDMERRLNSLLTAIDRFDQVMHQVRNQCGDGS